jgi:S1-C subfamily serine protease
MIRMPGGKTCSIAAGSGLNFLSISVRSTTVGSAIGKGRTSGNRVALDNTRAGAQHQSNLRILTSATSGQPAICPACGRRVPRHVDLCRCGFRISDAAGGWVPSSRSGDQEGSRVAALPIAVGFLVLVAAGVGIWYWANRTGAPSANGPTAVGQRTTAAPQASSQAPGAPSEPAANADAPALQPDSTRQPPDDQPIVPANSPETASLEDVVSRASPAVVTIETTATRGTGFFVSPDVVVTNAHVVDGHSYVTVKLAHGPSHTGRVTTWTPTYDLALVRVDRPPSRQSVLELAPAGGVRVGQEVVAIGSAMGVFQNSVTRGIVSALRRAGPVLLLQTDAAINPGNSGGPLVDRQGRVIGITTMKIGQEAESIGFAVAADHALALVKGERPSAVPGAGIVSTPGLAPGGSSDADDARESGAHDFDRSMQAAAKRAAEVDDYWSRFKSDCSPKLTVPAGDREWFGIWEERSTVVAPGGDCAAWLAELVRAASAFRTGMVAADEAARQAQVFPGVRREIRKKYRVEWIGWER